MEALHLLAWIILGYLGFGVILFTLVGRSSSYHLMSKKERAHIDKNCRFIAFMLAIAIALLV